MATFNLQLLDQLEERGLRAGTIDKLFSIDGIALYPPPEEARTTNTYRVTVKQVAAGQVADKGGLGGSEIIISGKVPWAQAGWLLAVQELFVTRASDESFIVFYDPVRRVSYECVVHSDSISTSVVEAHFYKFEIKMTGQVLGNSWVNAPLVEATSSGGINAFDLAALDWVYQDMEWAVQSYEASEAARQEGGVSGGSGNQQPTELSDGSSGDSNITTDFKWIDGERYVEYGGELIPYSAYKDITSQGAAQ